MNNKALFLFSKGVSHIGTKLFTFALSWYILSETGSGLSFSISLLVNYLPTIVISSFAGYISDRIDQPNRMLVLCDIMSAAVCIIPFLHLGLASVYATIFLLSAISSTFNNVIDTHLINLEGLDGEQQLKKLAAMTQFITASVNIIAPSLGGVIISFFPIQMFALVNMTSFLLSAFGEVFLRFKPHPAKDTTQVTGRAQEKLTTFLWDLFRQKELRTFLIGDSLSNFCYSAGFNVALPLIVTATLGISSNGYGLISSSTAVGSVLCALVRTKYPSKTEFRYPFIKAGGLGVSMLTLALIACLPYHATWSVAVLCILKFAVGWLAVDINIQTKTTLQIYVDSSHLGKALGVSTTISYILIPVSLIIGGIMTEIWPAYLLPAVSGGLLIFVLGLLKLMETNW